MAGPRSLPPLAAALLAAGCAATGPAFTGAPPPGDKALVYIYRPYSKWVSALQDAGFDVNGAKIGILDSGGYTYFHAPPGHYDITMSVYPVGHPDQPLHVVSGANPGDTTITWKQPITNEVL